MTKLGKIELVKLHICGYIKGSTDRITKKNKLPEPCQLLGCSGKFKKMPPTHEGLILSCYMDSETLESGDEIADRMKDRRERTHASEIIKR